MRPQLPENALLTLLRQCYTTPRCQLQPRSFHTSRLPHARLSSSSSASFRPQRRGFQTHSSSCENGAEHTVQFAAPASPSIALNSKHNIAILGGGITGLSAAHYLTRELPGAKITVYEGSERLGGWLQSKSFDVGTGTITFESGPRTLRPNTAAGLVVLEMIENLRLDDQFVITSKTSDAAQNRFVYYPDHLVKMPGPGQDLYSMAWGLLTEPAFSGLLYGAATEFSKPRRETADNYDNAEFDDESVGSFLERRFGNSDPGNNLVSAVLHGIYAGDINQLSARSLLPNPWHYEAQYGSISNGFYQQARNQTKTEDYYDSQLTRDMKRLVSERTMSKMGNASVYTFKQGIGALSTALETSLKANRNVQFKTGSKVKSVELDSEGTSLSVKTTKNMPSPKYTNVISTLYGRTLSEIANIPSLASMHAVTVMVVNLYFPDPNLLPERGFGYLIPRSIPFEQNPERALGIVFDSDATVGQDDVPGTKVTVMLGGHWWDGMNAYPDEEEGATMARSILARHLKVTDEPTRVQVSLQRDCIPQYVVGHQARMKKAHEELMEGFKGKLQVAGNSYTGVGLNDCVRAARDVVMSMVGSPEHPGSGLERLTRPKQWVTTAKA